MAHTQDGVSGSSIIGAGTTGAGGVGSTTTGGGAGTDASMVVNRHIVQADKIPSFSALTLQ